jgi:hypothetical protein
MRAVVIGLVALCLTAAAGRGQEGGEHNLYPIAIVEGVGTDVLCTNALDFLARLDTAVSRAEFNRLACEWLLLPSMAGLDGRRPFRLFFLAEDPPLGPPVPAALLPMVLGGSAYLASLHGGYGKARQVGRVLHAQNPRQEHLPDALHTAVIATQAVASPDMDALRWIVVGLRDRSLPPYGGPGMLRVVLPGTNFPLALKIAGGRLAQGGGSESPEDPFLKLTARLAPEIETLTAGIEVRPDGLTLTVQATACSNSALARAMANVRPPDPRFDRLLSFTNLYVASSGALGLLRDLPADYARWADEIASLSELLGCRILPGGEDRFEALRDVLGRDRAAALVPTEETAGLAFVQAFALRDAAAAEARLARLAAAPSDGAGVPVQIALRARRAADGTMIYACPRKIVAAVARTNAPGSASVDLGAAVISLSRRTDTDLAVRDGVLVVVDGPKDAIASVLRGLRSSPPAGSIAAWSRSLFPETGEKPCATACLAPMHTVRALAALLPGVTTAQLARFPEAGEGAALQCFVRGRDLVWVIRLGVREAQALATLVREQESLLQDLLNQILLAPLRQGHSWALPTHTSEKPPPAARSPP